MSELTTYEGRPLRPVEAVTDYTPTYSDPTGGRLVAWAAGLHAAHALGTALCTTAFVPAHFKGKAEECAAAILYGDEIHMTPMQALQGLYVISGKPALYARAMVAIVMAAGHDVWTVSKSDQSVTVAGRRRGTSHVIEETWTLARARKAGYTNNKKYDTDPQAMLYARAASDICRQVAPDALAGLAYSVEELELEAAETTTTVTRATPRATTAKRAPVEVPEPSFDDPTEIPGEAAANLDEKFNGEAGASTAQKGMYRALLAERKPGASREEILDLVVGTIGREVSSSNDLTMHEMGQVIDFLAALPVAAS